MYICGKYRVRVEDIVINYFWAAVEVLQGCSLPADLSVAACSVSQGRDFWRNTSTQKKKKINMIYDSNLCFADVNALVLTVKKKKDIKTSEGGKAGQFIVQKQ